MVDGRAGCISAASWPVSGMRHGERGYGAGAGSEWAKIQGIMPKYDPLRDHLAGLPRGQNSITLSFARVEALLGEPLPPSARAYDDWWRGRARWRKVIESRPW